MGLLKGLVTPQASTAKRTAAGDPELQRNWHKNVTKVYNDMLQHNSKLVGATLANKLMVYLVFNLDEECLLATGKTVKVVGSGSRTKHENQNGTSRLSISLVRCGCAAAKDTSGPTFFLIKGSERKPEYSDEFLENNGVAKGSSIIMTENAYLTDKAWSEITKKLTTGIRAKVKNIAVQHGVDDDIADQLQVVLALDGFKSHTNNYQQLIDLHKFDITVLCEERDSSHVNQVFDKFVVSV